MKALKGAFIWGSFEYSRDQLRDAEYNASLIDPLRGTPFFIADTYKSKWINQLYDMTVKAAAPKLWDRLIFGTARAPNSTTRVRWSAFRNSRSNRV